MAPFYFYLYKRLKLLSLDPGYHNRTYVTGTSAITGTSLKTAIEWIISAIEGTMEDDDISKSPEHHQNTH